MNTAKITVNGKEYSLLFGYTCYKLFISRCVKFKVAFLTEEGELTGLGLANLFHSAYLNHCFDKQIDPLLTFDQITEWLDDKYSNEEGQKEIVELLEIWAQSKEIKKLAEEVEKKSPNGMTEKETMTLTT